MKLIEMFAGCGDLPTGLELTEKYRVVAGNDFDYVRMSAFRSTRR